MLINTSQGISPEDISPDYRPKSGSIGEQESPWSRNSESADGCSVSDEQLMRAFELTVVLEEYGKSEKKLMFGIRSFTRGKKLLK